MSRTAAERDRLRLEILDLKGLEGSVYFSVYCLIRLREWGRCHSMTYSIG